MNGGNALINVTAWGEEEHEYAESTHESKAEGSVASGSILDPHCSKISTGKVVVPNWPKIHKLEYCWRFRRSGSWCMDGMDRANVHTIAGSLANSGDPRLNLIDVKLASALMTATAACIPKSYNELFATAACAKNGRNLRYATASHDRPSESCGRVHRAKSKCAYRYSGVLSKIWKGTISFSGVRQNVWAYKNHRFTSFYHSFERPTHAVTKGLLGKVKFAFHHSFERPTGTK